MTGERFGLIVGVHMECQVVNLMERFATFFTFEALLVAVCQLVILVVAFLVKSFTTELTDEWLVALMYSYVGIQSRASMKIIVV